MQCYHGTCTGMWLGWVICLTMDLLKSWPETCVTVCNCYNMKRSIYVARYLYITSLGKVRIGKKYWIEHKIITRNVLRCHTFKLLIQKQFESTHAQSLVSKSYDGLKKLWLTCGMVAICFNTKKNSQITLCYQ